MADLDELVHRAAKYKSGRANALPEDICDDDIEWVGDQRLSEHSFGIAYLSVLKYKYRLYGFVWFCGTEPEQDEWIPSYETIYPVEIIYRRKE